VRALGGIADLLTGLRGREQPRAPAARAQLVEPRVAHDAEHPARQRCVRPQLPGARQSPLDRDLHQVVGVVRISGERTRKAPQPRQQRDQRLAQLLRRRAHVYAGITFMSAIFFHFFPARLRSTMVLACA